MKKIVAIIWILTILTMCFLLTSTVFAENEINEEKQTEKTSESVLDNETQGKVQKLVEENKKSLEYYKEKYGSDAYGTTAYILNIISKYSIPFCFLGIAISGIYQYVIGIRKLDIQEKGLTLMVTFVTILVICQILPLAFAVVVKFGGR